LRCASATILSSLSLLNVMTQDHKTPATADQLLPLAFV